MSSIHVTYPHEYRFDVEEKYVRSFKDPHNEGLVIHHAYIPVKSFVNGITDKVNPRSHETLKGRVPERIEESLKERPTWFHILNRGELVLAKRAWYDNRAQTFHVLIESEDEHGLADGATTDRVLARVKAQSSQADFGSLTEAEMPAHLKQAYVHVEVISGDIGDMLVPLTDARNTSNPVKPFSLENLGGGFDWLREIIEQSEFRGRIKYKENDPEPVDIRAVLGLLTLFHPKWQQERREPMIAYTSKGLVLDYFKNEDWLPGYKALAPVVIKILRLYVYIQVHFEDAYRAYNKTQGIGSRLGSRKEVRYSSKTQINIALANQKTEYGISDGWIYPLLAAFRLLLVLPSNGRGSVDFITDPEKFFDEFGYEFVGDVVDQSEQLGRNPNATGKSRILWSNLRTKMELHRMKMEKTRTGQA